MAIPRESFPPQGLTPNLFKNVITPQPTPYCAAILSFRTGKLSE